jgi:hypothetical protein
MQTPSFAGGITGSVGGMTERRQLVETDGRPRRRLFGAAAGCSELATCSFREKQITLCN